MITTSIEHTRPNRTHWLITMYAGGGEFCDAVLPTVGKEPISTPVTSIFADHRGGVLSHQPPIGEGNSTPSINYRKAQPWR